MTDFVPVLRSCANIQLSFKMYYGFSDLDTFMPLSCSQSQLLPCTVLRFISSFAQRGCDFLHAGGKKKKKKDLLLTECIK